jgi:hypothetical protein
MTNQTNTPNAPQEAFIPPVYMLILALIGLIVALGVAFTQPSFTVVGWGALGIMVLSLVSWVFMAPAQAKAVLTGRTARFGGTSLLVTVIFLTALIAIYVVIRGQNWRSDLTQSNQFSLSAESRQAISGIAVDPKLPKVKLLAFYGASQAGRRDQDTLLFEDYKKTSSGKIDYEFVDPDRNPAKAKQYKVTTGGAIAVAALDDKGEPNVDKSQIVNFANQDDLTNAILRVAASGDFRAYFLKVDGGLQLTDTGAAGMSVLNDALTKRYNWKIQEVSTFELMGKDSKIKLKDPTADGEVLVIPGGNAPLTDEQLKFITDYLDKGGNLIIYAAPSIISSGTASSTDKTLPLALAPNLSDYLYKNYGLRFTNNVVLDPTLALQSPIVPVTIDFSRDNYITSAFAAGRTGIVFELPHSIETAPTLPADVTVNQLAKTSADSYAKTDMQAVVDGKLDKIDADAKGPFVLAAAAENAKTKSRVVLFGSSSVPANSYSSGTGLVNLDASFNSLVWTTRFNDYFKQVQIQTPVRPQDAPVFASDAVLRNINLLTLILLPFGVLAIGILVWWNNRERAR